MSTYQQRWPASYAEGKDLGKKLVERESSDWLQEAVRQVSDEVEKLKAETQETANEKAEQELAWYEGVLEHISVVDSTTERAGDIMSGNAV